MLKKELGCIILSKKEREYFLMFKGEIMGFENRICLPECYAERESAVLASIGKTLAEGCVDKMLMSRVLNDDMSFDRVGCLGFVVSFACRMCLADSEVNIQELAFLKLLLSEIENINDVREFAEICDDEAVDMLDALADDEPALVRDIVRLATVAAAIDKSFDRDTNADVYISEKESVFLLKLLDTVSD